MIMTLTFDANRTALLVMDCQRMLVDAYPANPENFLSLGAEVIKKRASPESKSYTSR